MKEKYKDQDDEDKEIIMQLLGVGFSFSSDQFAQFFIYFKCINQFFFLILLVLPSYLFLHVFRAFTGRRLPAIYRRQLLPEMLSNLT